MQGTPGNPIVVTVLNTGIHAEVVAYSQESCLETLVTTLLEWVNVNCVADSSECVVWGCCCAMSLTLVPNTFRV